MGNGRSRTVSYETNKLLSMGSIYDPINIGEEDYAMPLPLEIQEIYNAYRDKGRIETIGNKDFTFSKEQFIKELKDLGIKYGGANRELLDAINHPENLEFNFKETLPTKYLTRQYNLISNMEAIKSVTTEFKKATGKKLIDTVQFVKRINNDKNESTLIIGLTVRDTDRTHHIFLTELVLTMNTKYYENNNNHTAIPILSQGVITHELGHAVLNTISLSPVYKHLTDQHFKKIKKYGAVSVYGTVNEEENFAESFSLYVHGVEKTNLGDKGYQDFKKLMINTKMSGMFGIVKDLPEKVSSHYSKAKKTITKPKPTTLNLPSLNFSGGNVTIKMGGVIKNFTLTPARKKRGFFTVTIDGKKYKVDVSTKQIIEMG